MTNTGQRLMAMVLVLSVSWFNDATVAQTDTTFTYQGELMDNGSLANGTFDLDFSLWDDALTGIQVGSTITLNSVPVTDGKFVVELDYGANAFDNGGRWLEVTVMGVTLSPRHPITRSPYSIQTRGIFVADDDKVGIGTTDPQHLLHVVGDTNAANAIYGFSTELANTAAGVYGRSASSSGYGVYGYASALNGSGTGVFGKTDSSFGYGVFAHATHPLGQTYGVYSSSQSTGGTGVYGEATNFSGTTYGVYGKARSSTGTGVYGHASSGSGNTYGVYGKADSATGKGVFGEGLWGIEGNSTDPDGRGVFGFGASLTGTNYGVYGLTPSENGRGVYGYATNNSGLNFGVYGETASGTGRGVFGFASDTAGVNHGVHGESDSVLGRGVVGHATSLTGTTQGMRGEVESPTGIGMFGLNNAGSGDAWGVLGQSESSSGNGVYGTCAGTNGTGVIGVVTATTGTTFGVYGSCTSPDGYAFFANSAGTDYGSISSRRWKRNIVAIDDPLGKLSQIRGVYYDWDEEHGSTHDVGMIAEEVGAVLPEIVQYEENGVDAIGMDYSRMTPLLVEAVNVLHATHETELTSIRAENKSLRARIDELEHLVEQIAATLEKE